MTSTCWCSFAFLCVNGAFRTEEAKFAVVSGGENNQVRFCDVKFVLGVAICSCVLPLGDLDRFLMRRRLEITQA